MKKYQINFSLVFLLALGVSTSQAASFDCAKATTAREREICADTELSNLDERLSVSYSRALTVAPDLKTSQREWLKSLRQCESQPSLGSCLKSAYIARIAAMNFIGNPNRGLIGVEIRGLAKRGEQNLLEIGAIAPNSPAFEAAIETGEYFSEINGKSIADMSHVYELLNVPAGTLMTFRVVRYDGSERNVQLKLASRVSNEGFPRPEQVPVPSQASIESAKDYPAKLEAQPGAIENSKKNQSSGSSSSSNLGAILLLVVLLGGYIYFKKKTKKNNDESDEFRKFAALKVEELQQDEIKSSSVDPYDEIYMQALLMYKRGDLEKAKHLFNEGANNGHVESQFYFGKLLVEESKDSSDANFTVGEAWIKTAAKNGNLQALALVESLDSKIKPGVSIKKSNKTSKSISIADREIQTHSHLCGECGWHGDSSELDHDDGDEKCPNCKSYDVSLGVYPVDDDLYAQAVCSYCGWSGDEDEINRNDDDELACPSCQHAGEVTPIKIPQKNWYGNNEDLILKVLSFNGHVFRDLNTNLQNERKFALAASGSQIAVLEELPEKFKSDKQIVMNAVSASGSLLAHASDQLKNDREIVKAAIENWGGAFEYASERIRGDKELALIALESSGRELAHASTQLKEDREVVLVAVENDGSAIEFAAEHFKADKLVVKVALSSNYSALQYVDAKFKADKKITFPIVSSNGWALEYLADELKDDKDIVLAAVTDSGCALQFASENMRADHDIVKAAVEQDEDAVEYSLIDGDRPTSDQFSADDSEIIDDKATLLAAVKENGYVLMNGTDELRSDKEVVLAAVTDSGNALQYASEELRNDIDVVLAAIANNAYAFQEASQALRSNRDIVLRVVKEDGYVLQYANENFRSDREIILLAVSSNSSALEFADEKFKNDKEIVLAAMKNSGSAIEHVSDRLKSDKDVVLAAVENHAHALQSADEKYLRDKEVVLVALASCGDLLYCVSKELKADVDVIKTALANDRRAFQYVDDELREDEVFVGEMMTQYGVYLQHAHGSLKNNQVLREIAKKNLYERLKATGELIDVYSEEWLSKQSDDAILNSSMAKEFDEKFGVEYRSSLQVAYLCGRDDSLEFSVVHSKLRKQIKDGTHFPDFLFFNNLTDQILCVGLGRKNRIFVLDSETNDVIDVFGVPSTPSSNKKYIFEFARLDHAGVIKTIVHALAEAASFMDEQAEIDDYESSEFEELSDQIYEAVSKIQAFFPQCEGGDLNTNDY